MRQSRDRAAYVDRAVLLFLLALFLLVSPLKAFWASSALPWYTPYLLWGGVIALAFRLQGHHTDEL